MFTGIITDTTDVSAHAKQDGAMKMTFKKPKGWTDLTLGESVATDGVCLTVSDLRDDAYDVVLMAETLAKTSFSVAVPSRVNLERALRLSDRLSGHMVQGHVDGVGHVVAIDETDGWVVTVQFPADQKALVIPKGSITINGVSLTVARLEGDQLSVALIPHTLEHTTIGLLQVGDAVNLEFDMIGKYISNLMKERTA